jgi:hypothetical protein
MHQSIHQANKLDILHAHMNFPLSKTIQFLVAPSNPIETPAILQLPSRPIRTRGILLRRLHPNLSLPILPLLIQTPENLCNLLRTEVLAIRLDKAMDDDSSDVDALLGVFLR